MKVTFTNFDELKAALPMLRAAERFTAEIDVVFIQPIDVVCEHCGKEFLTTNSKARFCTPSCKTLAWRKRRQAS